MPYSEMFAGSDTNLSETRTVKTSGQSHKWLSGTADLCTMFNFFMILLIISVMTIGYFKYFPELLNLVDNTSEFMKKANHTLNSLSEIDFGQINQTLKKINDVNFTKIGITINEIQPVASNITLFFKHLGNVTELAETLQKLDKFIVAGCRLFKC